MSDQPITETEREAHLFDFRGGPIVIWVPRSAELIEAQVQGARMVAEQAGSAAEPDPDLVTVGMPTKCLLAMVCRDPKDPAGWPRWPGPDSLIEDVSEDDQVVLLDLLNAAVLKERKASAGGPYRAAAESDEADDLDLVGSLAGCADLSEAMELLAGWHFARVVRLAWDLSKVAAFAGDEGSEPL